MGLPTAVRTKADRAAELIRGQGKTPPGTPENPAPAPADSASELQRLRDENARLTAAQNVLQGKYNAETKRLAEEAERARKEAEQLKAENPPPPFDASKLKSVDEETRARLGDDLIVTAANIAREVVDDALSTRLKPLEERADAFQRQSEATYYATLDREAPQNLTQNDDPKFLTWLQQPDPATGQMRHELLRRADALRQGFVVADIFNAFRDGREIGARSDAPRPREQSPSPPPDAGNPRPLEDDKGAITWTRASVAQFYADKRRGVYSKEEAGRIENDLFKAQREGRIQG